jgi:transposase InsO family protein
VTEAEREEIIAQVTKSALPVRQALSRLGLPKSTYYRWLKPQNGNHPRIPWNKLSTEEEAMVLDNALQFPELSPRQLGLKITDDGLYISESTVYRILKREGLIKPAQIKGFKASHEYHHKTRRPNEMWATDCSYLKVTGWGYYYLVTVMDDFSRFILAWQLKTDMSANSLIDVTQEAVDLTGMTDVPVEDRTFLLSDNGSGYLSRKFSEYLRLVGIKHIVASPYHPQTNGKIERYHRTIKGKINLIPYDTPSELENEIASFVRYYNYYRYHEALKNVTPYAVYTGKQIKILENRNKVKAKTLERRKLYNSNIRRQGLSLESVL